MRQWWKTEDCATFTAEEAAAAKRQRKKAKLLQELAEIEAEEQLEVDEPATNYSRRATQNERDVM